MRDASRFAITDEEFKQFLNRHANQPKLVPEDNEKMKNSYLILDEYMRFLNCTNDAKEPTKSILKVTVEQALAESGFDEEMFEERGRSNLREN